MKWKKKEKRKKRKKDKQRRRGVKDERGGKGENQAVKQVDVSHLLCLWKSLWKKSLGNERKKKEEKSRGRANEKGQGSIPIGKK